MKHHFTPEGPGNLPNMAAAFGLSTLCTCGEMEIYHDANGRCDILGSTCQHFTPAIARKPAATIQPVLARRETA